MAKNAGRAYFRVETQSSSLDMLIVRCQLESKWKISGNAIEKNRPIHHIQCQQKLNISCFCASLLCDTFTVCLEFIVLENVSNGKVLTEHAVVCFSACLTLTLVKWAVFSCPYVEVLYKQNQHIVTQIIKTIPRNQHTHHYYAQSTLYSKHSLEIEPGFKFLPLTDFSKYPTMRCITWFLPGHIGNFMVWLIVISFLG